MAFTGLRRAEACGLRWSDLDLGAATLNVAVTLNQIKGEVYEDTTKSEGSARTVDLDDETIAVLRSWRARQAEMRLLVGPGWSDSGRVFCMPDGSAVRPDTLTQAWTRSVQRTGMRRIVLHDLRHTPRHPPAGGARQPPRVADRLGHADPSFTIRTYVHTLPGAQRTNAQAVAALVRNSVTKSATKAASEASGEAS